MGGGGHSTSPIYYIGRRHRVGGPLRVAFCIGRGHGVGGGHSASPTISRGKLQNNVKFYPPLLTLKYSLQLRQFMHCLPPHMRAQDYITLVVLIANDLSVA